MISREYRAIYIHQRKTAGMSIIRAFGYDPAQPDWHRYNDGVLDPEWRTRPAAEREFLAFSSVRNPFDRVVSAWKYLPTTKDRPLEEVLADPPTAGHDFRHFTRPQVAILGSAPGSALVVHDLVRFENLQADFDRICERIGKPPCALGHVNSSRREPGWRPYFTATARDLAEGLFAEDLAVFDYAF